MKKLLFLFWLVSVCLNLRAGTTNEFLGEWSEAVNGLRGRFIITPAGKKDGVTELRVFLELQNVAHIVASFQMDDVYSGRNLRCNVQDSDGGLLASSLAGIRRFERPPTTLVVPQDSSVRWNVNWHEGAYMIAREQKDGVLIALDNDVWQIEEVQKDYFLEGTFQVAETKPSTPVKWGNMRWSSTLKIPKIKIPRK